MIFNLKNCSKSDLGAVSLIIGPRGGGNWGVEIRVRRRIGKVGCGDKSEGGE